MTGRELLEMESVRFEALSPAEQEEELRGQREAEWLVYQRDKAMIAPSLFQPAAKSSKSSEGSRGEVTESFQSLRNRPKRSTGEMPPAPLYFVP